jgi:hypothetical protein
MVDGDDEGWFCLSEVATNDVGTEFQRRDGVYKINY